MGDMKAVVMYGPRDLWVEARPRPAPAPGEVLVALRECGVCAGDLYIYKGKNPYVVYPQARTLGGGEGDVPARCPPVPDVGCGGALRTAR